MTVKTDIKIEIEREKNIVEVNICVVSVMTYGAGILKFYKDDIKSLNRRTRKFMTMDGKFT